MVSEDDPLRIARELADSYRGQARKAPKKKGTPAKPVLRRGNREDALGVDGIVRDLINQQGWTSPLAGTRVFSEWSTIVGPQIAQHSTVEHFADGVVHIAASSTTWAKELTMLAPRIVAKLNNQLGDGQVQRIVVRGPQAPSWSKGPRSVKGRGPRDTYG